MPNALIEQRQFGWQDTWPVQLAKNALAAFALPGQVAGGVMNVQPTVPGQWSDIDEARAQLTSNALVDRSSDLAGLIMSGSSLAPAGAVGAGPAGLRDRFFSVLYDASGGKDPRRIKLTPERMEVAKTLLREQMDRQRATFGSQPSPYRETKQAIEAEKFASAARRQGVGDVRVKFSDGPYGSVYVRVGDKGTVRFADHPPAIDHTGQAVGGFSKELGRRHYPATVDVSPQRTRGAIDATPAYDFLSGILKLYQ